MPVTMRRTPARLGCAFVRFMRLRGLQGPTRRQGDAARQRLLTIPDGSRKWEPCQAFPAFTPSHPSHLGRSGARGVVEVRSAPRRGSRGHGVTAGWGRSGGDLEPEKGGTLTSLPVRAVQAQPLPAFQPSGVGLDQTGPPGIIPLPIRFKFLNLQDRLPTGAVTAFS